MFIFERFFRDFGLLIGALLLYLIMGDTQILWQNSGLLAVVLIAPVSRLIQYRCTFYSIDDKQLVIQTGWFKKRRQEVPISNITTVDFSQNIFFQLARVYSVSVDNASSIGDGKSGNVRMVLKIQDAVYVKKLLLAKEDEGLEKAAAGEAHENKSIREDRISEDASGNTILASIGEILLMGVLRSKVLVIFQLFAYCGIAISIVSKIFLEKEVDGDEVMASMLMSISAPLIILFGILGVYLLGIIASVALSTIRYYGFRVTDRETSIFIEYGLLTRKTHTLLKEKISGVSYQQSLLMRIFGRGTLEIFAVGYGGVDEAGQTEVAMLYPVMKQEKLYDFLERFLPEVKCREEYRRTEPKALPYFFLCARFFCAVGVCAGLCAALLAPIPQELFPWYAAAGAAVIAWAGVSVFLEYKNTALSVSGQLVALIRGGYTRKTVLLKTEKIEFAAEHASQRKRKKKGITSIRLGILAPAGVSSYEVRNLSMEAFHDLRRRLMY